MEVYYLFHIFILFTFFLLLEPDGLSFFQPDYILSHCWEGRAERVGLLRKQSEWLQ